MNRYFPTTEYIGSGEYVGDMVQDESGEWVKYEQACGLLRETIDALEQCEALLADLDGERAYVCSTKVRAAIAKAKGEI